VVRVGTTICDDARVECEVWRLKRNAYLVPYLPVTPTFLVRLVILPAVRGVSVVEDGLFVVVLDERNFPNFGNAM
jgi:hypothetical protein